MTDRGLPLVDGAPACPFVAFEDDRDARATAPDHRHRCYAEARPAPRALAHQEAYCLASAFPVCPTFQDWARREAAAARPGSAAAGAGLAEAPVAASRATEPRAAGRDVAEGSDPDVSAPPPWLTTAAGSAAVGGTAARSSANVTGRTSAAGDVEPPAFLAPRITPAVAPASDGRGLAGSPADRLAGGEDVASVRAPSANPQTGDGVLDGGSTDGSSQRGVPASAAFAAGAVGGGVAGAGAAAGPAAPGGSAAPPPAARPTSSTRGPRDAKSERDPTPPRGSQVSQVRRTGDGASSERLRRNEAYPSLRTRMGLSRLPGGSILAGLAALIIAAVLLFMLPGFLGVGRNGDSGGDGNGGAAASPSESAAVATATPAPTAPPKPTPQTYTIATGDTLSRVAKRFGVTLEALLAANPQIKNPDRLGIGDVLVIPSASPSGASRAPSGATAPSAATSPSAS
ncbi:MAG: LysM peptidoglycan-binding domain-containing protein [Chloroflexota bacterium]